MSLIGGKSARSWQQRQFQVLVIAFFVLLVQLGEAQDKDEEVSYDGHVVYRSVPQTDKQLSILQSFKEKEVSGIEFWQEPIAVNRSVDILASPSAIETLAQIFKASRIPTEVLIENVGKKIKDNNRGRGTFRHNSRRLVGSHQNLAILLQPKVYYTNYQRFATFESKLASLQVEFPEQVTVEAAGNSYEGRPLYLVKISNSTSRYDTNSTKPIIFIDGLHHAREWVSHSTAMYLMESFLGKKMPTTSKQRSFQKSRRPRRRRHLVKRAVEESLNCTTTLEKAGIEDFINFEGENSIEVDSNQTTKMSPILDKYDIWFVPMVNPDGYEYSQTSNRLWRKTKSNNVVCQGVDPNRNYPFKWAVSGASNYPCDETYAGPAPLSEPETNTLARILDNNRERIKMYLTLHAYSQVIISPWGYMRGYPSTYQELKRVAEAGIKAIEAQSGTRYQFGTAANLLYPASGGSDDYAYGHLKIPYSYTMELPDTGRHGFLLPPSEIARVGKETFQGVVTMIEAMR